MPVSWSPKDPDEVLDYGIDWSPRLAVGDVITASTWEIESGGDALEIDADDFDGDSTTVWLSGGTLGNIVLITNRVTTQDGRTHDQTARLRIRMK